MLSTLLGRVRSPTFVINVAAVPPPVPAATIDEPVLAPRVVELALLHPAVEVPVVPNVPRSPDLHCYENIDEAQHPLEDDCRRSNRLKSKELQSRELVAAAAIRIKKRKLGDATPGPKQAGQDCTSTAPTPPLAPPPLPPSVPSWSAKDLNLLGRACSVLETTLSLPVLRHSILRDGWLDDPATPTPAVDPLD